MPALDPYAAFSRPMINFDQQPSAPLQFAQTLHARDQNKPSPEDEETPRIREREKLPTTLPNVPYAHARHASLDLKSLEVVDKREVDTVGNDEWMQAMVAQCLDSAKADLDLSSKGLTLLSTKVEDLGNLVTLTSYSPNPATTRTSTFSRSPSQMSAGGAASPMTNHEPNFFPGAGHLAANSRSFSRTASAPLRSSSGVAVFPAVDESRENRGLGLMPVEVHPVETASSKAFRRSKTGAARFVTSRDEGPLKGRREIELNVANNRLTSLPSVLFQITNLTYLSLRANKLTELPAGIGELRNLKELNIANNPLTFLPSTILDLVHLEHLSIRPNSHLLERPHLNGDASDHTTITNDPTPATVSDPSRPISPGRTLGPLISHHTHPIPRLTTIITNFLISPLPPSNHPPLLDFDWRSEEKGEPHPLLDTSALHRRIPSIPEGQLSRVLQALKSASRAATENASKSLAQRGHRRNDSSHDIDPFPQSHRTLPPDDAARNPYFYPCPSPRHREFSVERGAVGPHKHLFLDPAEERIEWRELFGEKDVPIRWMGCSPGCLAFLEQADEEEEWWGVEEDE